MVFTLALSVVPFVFIQDVFANSFDVELDEEYYFGDTLLVLGTIQEVGMPVIAMSIYDPDGVILAANNLEISPDGEFSKMISLSSPSYEKIGEYLIEFHYGQISETVPFTMMSGEPESDNSESLEQESNEFENDEPGTVLVFTDKAVYRDNDTVTIYGSVSKFTSPTVLLGVHDPFGMPTGFYFGNLNSENEFSTSFLVKAGVNFRVDGTYVIKAHYGEFESSVSFDFQKDLEDTTTEDTTTEDTTTEDTTTEDTTTEDTTTEDTTTEDTTTEDTTTEDTTTEDTTTEDTTTEDTTTEDTTTEDTTTEDTTTEDTTTEDTTTEDTTTEDTTTEDTTTEDTTTEDTTTEDTTTEDTTTEDTTTEDPMSSSEIVTAKTDPENQKKPSNDNLSDENKNYNNLSVEDVELGKLLNQINLDCDSSIYVDTISYYDGMGPALYRLCNFEDALIVFDQTLLSDPNNVEILVNKGSTLGKLGYFSEAILHYNKAIKIDSEFLPALNNKANALANIGNYEEASNLYNQILEKNPNYHTAKTNLETVTFELNRYSTTNIEKVESDVKVSPEIEPEDKIVIEYDSAETNLFEKISNAFSNLGSLFKFLN